MALELLEKLFFRKLGVLHESEYYLRVHRFLKIAQNILEDNSWILRWIGVLWTGVWGVFTVAFAQRVAKLQLLDLLFFFEIFIQAIFTEFLIDPDEVFELQSHSVRFFPSGRFFPLNGSTFFWPVFYQTSDERGQNEGLEHGN
jgi:hypothetical protein